MCFCKLINESMVEFLMQRVEALMFPQKNKLSRETRKLAKRHTSGGWRGQVVTQTGRLSSGVRGQLAHSSLLGSHRGGFLYAHLLQTAPPLLCTSGSLVYLLPPPLGSVQLPHHFHGTHRFKSFRNVPRATSQPG